MQSALLGAPFFLTLIFGKKEGGTNRALQERLSAAAADGYNVAVEKLIARAEALRPKPIREQMANAAKEAAKENAARPAPAKGKEARDDR